MCVCTIFTLYTCTRFYRHGSICKLQKKQRRTRKKRVFALCTNWIRGKNSLHNVQMRTNFNCCCVYGNLKRTRWVGRRFSPTPLHFCSIQAAILFQPFCQHEETKKYIYTNNRYNITQTHNSHEF